MAALERSRPIRSVRRRLGVRSGRRKTKQAERRHGGDAAEKAAAGCNVEIAHLLLPRAPWARRCMGPNAPAWFAVGPPSLILLGSMNDRLFPSNSLGKLPAHSEPPAISALQQAPAAWLGWDRTAHTCVARPESHPRTGRRANRPASASCSGSPSQDWPWSTGRGC